MLFSFKIIEEFLPQMASREEIEKVARQKMVGVDMSDKAATGKLIGAVLKEFGGRADGKDVQEVVRSVLT